MTHRCTFTKANGVRCKAIALTGKEHCVFHDKDSKINFSEAGRKGGLNRRIPASTLPQEALPLRLRSPEDVTVALAETYNLVRNGTLAVSVGNCLAVIGQAILRAMEKSDLERRLEALETKSVGRGI